MTSPAQKAAGEIEASVRADIARAFPSYADKCNKPLPKTLAQYESIIQQAITEAVDAAVALERAKYARKVTEWRMKARNAVPIEYAIRAMNYKYLKGDNSAAGWDDCADELESLVKQP